MLVEREKGADSRVPGISEMGRHHGAALSSLQL
jgi:hypothetical protein